MVGDESSWWGDDCKPVIALNPVGNSSLFLESLSLIEKCYFSILIVIQALQKITLHSNHLLPVPPMWTINIVYFLSRIIVITS